MLGEGAVARVVHQDGPDPVRFQVSQPVRFRRGFIIRVDVEMPVHIKNGGIRDQIFGGMVEKQLLDQLSFRFTQHLFERGLSIMPQRPPSERRRDRAGCPPGVIQSS